MSKMLKLVHYTQIWPLSLMACPGTWSNKHKEVTMMSNAAHCMQNLVPQGTETAMEDRALFGRVPDEVVCELLLRLPARYPRTPWSNRSDDSPESTRCHCYSLRKDLIRLEHPFSQKPFLVRGWISPGILQ